MIEKKADNGTLGFSAYGDRQERSQKRSQGGAAREAGGKPEVCESRRHEQVREAGRDHLCQSERPGKRMRLGSRSGSMGLKGELVG